jgi:hypothetical protein
MTGRINIIKENLTLMVVFKKASFFYNYLSILQRVANDAFKNSAEPKILLPIDTLSVTD